MFNLWKRTYVQLFSQRNIFDTKSIVADSQWSKIILPETIFTANGSLVHQENSLKTLIDKQYDGQIGQMFTELLTDSDEKWSIVVGYDDYHQLLAYYLKELQHTYKFTDADLHLLAYSYIYNNFYYSKDQNFVDGFVGQTQQDAMKKVFAEYTPTGVLDLIAPGDLPTEIGYFLVSRKLVSEDALQENFVNVAKLVVSRLWSVHFNDFSEWLILDTPHFLNMLKAPESAEVNTAEFSFPDMLNFMKTDPYLNAMFFSSINFFGPEADWDTDPNFKVTASRVVAAWKGLADYLVQRGIDADWAQLRHSQYAEIILRYEYVNNTCQALQYILQLDGAPETVDKPLVEMLGYDVLSECMNSKYNKTLLLLTLRGMSSTFQGFITDAFAE
ncbi:hypothetical protein D3C87_1339770 [compost metagenome]